MGGEDETLKTIVPFLQRADELQRHDRLMAYYCRLYAMERGLKIPSKERSKDMNDLLLSLMGQLEKDKKEVARGSDDYLYVEGVAHNVFGKADKQDRAGRADMSTAKAFYAASIFYQVLQQFGEVAPEIEQKQKYAIWKAADIRKALSEGRQPTPGPLGGLPQSDSAQEGDGSEEFAEMSLQQEQQQPMGPPMGSSSSSQPTGHHPSGTSPRPESSASFLPSVPSAPASLHSHAGTSAAAAAASAAAAAAAAAAPALPSQFTVQSAQDRNQDRQNFQNPQGQSYQGPNSQGQNTQGSWVPSPYGVPSSTPAGGGFSSHLPPMPPPPLESPIGSTTLGKSNSLSAVGLSMSGDTMGCPPDKIVAAHKAARFAVSALAFDDVPTAVEHLRTALNLLTNPSYQRQ